MAVNDGGGPAQTTARHPIRFVRSDKDTNFTTAIAAGAEEQENITGLASNFGMIESVVVLSEDNLAWEVHFWRTDGFENVDLDLDSWIERVEFTAADGEATPGIGTTFRYSQTNLGIPYEDGDATNELHVSVVNRSGSAKGLGAAGELVVIVGFRPE